MNGYKAYREQFHTDYWGDRIVGDALLVFPESRIKVPFSLWHFAVPKDHVSLVKNIRRFNEPDYDWSFGKGDIGLEKLPELNPEEWNDYMKHELGWSRYEFGYLPFEFDEDFAKLLEQKLVLGETESEFDEHINEGLRQILFSH